MRSMRHPLCEHPDCIALPVTDGVHCAAHAAPNRGNIHVERYLDWVFADPLDEYAAHRIPAPWDDRRHWTEDRPRGMSRVLSGHK